MKPSTTDPDRPIIESFRQGNIGAFRQLVDKYKDLSLSLALSILKDREVAEEVLQEAFIKVFEKLETFRFRSTFTTWLYRIVVNTSYNRLRADTKRRISHYDVQLIPSGEKIGPEKLREAEQKKYINLALTYLKADEALVLRLFYLGEFKIAEIRKITGFSVSKIKVDLHRGRANLENCLVRILGNEIKNLL